MTIGLSLASTHIRTEKNIPNRVLYGYVLQHFNKFLISSLITIGAETAETLIELFCSNFASYILPYENFESALDTNKLTDRTI